ncbi:large conductance mechanosensitive channel protein MscL [Enterococcus faecalis]|nr:large conductance mechanosensitive channel protein MscL [Enterococcus faecalis]EGO7756790.1 large conductance mechanosensitive channel protein MscL [Enterococcus faecalis]EIB6519558.1 large conductance mechanosensitive channel protein MscL [Enterococcus faecalis]EKE4879607.1 large conductance mechanosensitive channel protein MscL [Enterococcus faecalis]EMC0702286.1 large conductance mechanosensitive channel protein MscL [Enterococcus faecalis]KAJ84748.1 Large-conductance mechanosensitive ch
MIKEFKEFLMRGSVLDLAIGVVMGSAFTAIVNKVVEGLITPLISLVFVTFMDTKSADDAFGGLVVPINGVKFDFGAVISAIVTFIITAFVLFMIVKLVNRLKEVSTSQKVEEEEEAKESVEDYLEQIRDLLSK